MSFQRSWRAPWWTPWLAAAVLLVTFSFKPVELSQFLFGVAAAAAAFSLLVVVIWDRDHVREVLESVARHGGTLRLTGGTDFEFGRN